MLSGFLNLKALNTPHVFYECFTPGEINILTTVLTYLFAFMQYILLHSAQ